MSWTVVLVLSAGAYLFKVAGLVALPRLAIVQRLTDVVALLPPALLMALVVTQTVGGEDGSTIDARLAGLAAGALAVWQRAPFLVVVAVSAAVAAAVRAVV